MISLFYDTETNGLPLWDKPSDDPGQPRITQLAWELVHDETKHVYAAGHAIMKPDGWEIPAELQALTGVTMDIAHKYGMPVGIVLPTFVDAWRKADQRVAHNESFDMRMVRIELMRGDYAGQLLGGTSTPLADFWKAGKAFCTQANSQKIVNLPATVKMHASGQHGPKPPKLEESYKHFAGKELENAHNAAVDVMACKTVYFGILEHRAAQQ